MGPIQFVRSSLGMVLLPILTFIASLLAILQGGLLRFPPPKLQWIPRYWGRMLAWVNGVTIRVEGLDKLDAGRSYIFAANHQSQFDIFVLQGYMPFDFRWMAKKELFRIPFFGWGMRLAGYIPVDRSGGRRAVKSLDEAAERIAAGTSVIIFPEGTRSYDGNMLPFKPGAMVLAIKSGVELVPMSISGTHGVLPKGRLLPRSGRVMIRLGDPIDTRQYTVKQKQELAEQLQAAVAVLKEEGDRQVVAA